MNFERRGLGADSGNLIISESDSSKSKQSFINWNKTAKRFQKLSQENKSVFMEEEEDE